MFREPAATPQTLHGILRVKFPNRRLGDHRARQVGVLTSTAIIVLLLGHACLPDDRVSPRKLAGVPILILHGEPASSLPMHIVNGYPELAGEYRAGKIAAEEVEDASRIEIQKPPATEEVVRKALTQDLLGYMWTVENRLRAAEGKAAVTRDQFLDSVKEGLGL